MSKRVLYVDWVRGFAILYMSFWHVFHFFSRYSIYADFPFFYKSINATIAFPVVVAFSGMAGAGLYLYLKKSHGEGFKRVLPLVFKRYLWLIVLSFFLTLLVWDLCTFSTWSEAIQGIGIVGLFSFFLLYFELHPLLTVFLSIFLGVSQHLVKPVLVSLASAYPLCVTSVSTTSLISFTINALFRGFFSVLNLLPLALWGASMTRALENNDWRKILLLGSSLIVFSVFLHFNNWPINFYERSSASFLLEIGILTVVMSCMKGLSSTRLTPVLSLALLPFGRDALVVYLANFLLVYKPLALLGAENSFSVPASFAASIVFLLLSNVVINLWRKRYS
jgi:hypothetical protein